MIRTVFFEVYPGLLRLSEFVHERSEFQRVAQFGQCDWTERAAFPRDLEVEESVVPGCAQFPHQRLPPDVSPAAGEHVQVGFSEIVGDVERNEFSADRFDEFDRVAARQIQVAGVEADAEFRPSGQFDDVQKFGGGRVESGDAQRPIQPPSTR